MNMHTPRLRNTLFAAAAAFGFVGLGAAIHSGPSIAHAAPAGIPTDGTIADVAERTVDSVVNISTSHQSKTNEVVFDPFGNGGGDDQAPQRELAKGSGVIVTASGRILTNAHVVDGA